MDQVIDKIADELKPIELGVGPTAGLVDFTPQEFVPTVKLYEGGCDLAIVTQDDCRLAGICRTVYAGEGNVAKVVCDECAADAKAVGFGGGPVIARCKMAPKLIEMRPRTEWGDPPLRLTVITQAEYVDELTDTIDALRPSSP